MGFFNFQYGKKYENDWINIMDIKVDDLVLEKPKQEMSLAEIFDLINGSIINKENWKIEDLADGKEIDIFPEWSNYVDIIAEGYRKCGWELFVFQTKKDKRQYFSFVRPKEWN